MERGNTSSSSAATEFPFTAADFQTIVGIVYKRSGIVLNAHKRDMTYSRLSRRLRALGLRSFRDYCALLESREGDGEASFLIDAITTNLTKFFREAHHFDFLKEHVLAPGAQRRNGERSHIRLWSAGCSTGEEPYSIAMVAAALQREAMADWDLRVLATDLDTNVVKKARAGIYPRACLENVPAAMRETFFERRPEDRNTVQVRRNIQDLVSIRQLNLLSPWPFHGKFDAIFCRNVMIYFDAATKAALIERFHAQLKEGGWLFVGHSESLLDHQARFKLCGRTVYRKIGQ
ncbi:CheR family methyltransferase [Rhodomicrobium lacus]|jgi:chemotaxis protein methyltransferase CheR|uniref:CheR family methyltransferase n=1 Tax=Rhodomicrobium TaxID=1068 RepID=UPI000F8E417D|nr:protein-glutamate O-methyltransferase [Rhodomicrobium lacus]WKW50664.1 protein-glutamate O-methyltransferase [Rhodomicrobium lacus]